MVPSGLSTRSGAEPNVHAARVSESCRGCVWLPRSFPRNAMPTGIENKLPTVTKVRPTALRALLSSLPASNNPAPVPMINRVMLIMPTSGSVRGTSRMMSSLSFLKLLHIVDQRYRMQKRQGHGIGTLKTAFPFRCSKQRASAQKSERWRGDRMQFAMCKGKFSCLRPKV